MACVRDAAFIHFVLIYHWEVIVEEVIRVNHCLFLVRVFWAHLRALELILFFDLIGDVDRHWFFSFEERIWPGSGSGIGICTSETLLRNSAWIPNELEWLDLLVSSRCCDHFAFLNQCLRALDAFDLRKIFCVSSLRIVRTESRKFLDARVLNRCGSDLNEFLLLNEVVQGLNVRVVERAESLEFLSLFQLCFVEDFTGLLGTCVIQILCKIDFLRENR